MSDIGGGANKRLGQHFLIDPHVLETIVETASLHSGDRVLEIGPGLGVLTGALLDRGAEVVAIEQDRRFTAYLEKKFHGRPLSVHYGDAAILHWHSLIEEGVWKFVSNLPYSITSLALRKALWAPKPPSNVVVLVQREVAERAIARNGKTSLLSLMVAFASSSSRIVKRVSAGAFYPPPKVESAILQVVPLSQAERLERWGIEPEKIMELAKKGFAHPRKFLASNLEIDAQILKKVGLNEKARAEDLSPDEWARLTIELI